MNTKKILADIGLHIPHILLPNGSIDLTKYAVNACDQFTSQPEYWQETEAIVGKAQSTLRLILPEVYLKEGKVEERTQAINQTMREYLDNGVLQDYGEMVVYVQRQTSGGVRHGLVIAVDLEMYDFHPKAQTPIRATEATVEDRLPIRIKIREQACLETPHIMLLYNDHDNRLNKYLAAHVNDWNKLYDFELMQQGGRLKGWQVNNPENWLNIAEILSGCAMEDGFLFAVGDGNHSLATAKCCWEQLKENLSPEEQATHPARYSLVELVNLYDPSLYFEPIHRLLLNVDPEQVQKDLNFDAKNPPSMQTLQPQLDIWMQQHPEVKIDYIHGADDCRKLADKPNSLAIVWREFPKDRLFRVIQRDGCFVRKSFSMGQARDKRYYMECRKIR